MGIWERWHEATPRANIAIAGAGFIGRGLAYRLERTPGINPALIINRTVESGVLAYKLAGRDPNDVIVSDDANELASAIASGTAAVTSSIEASLELEEIDVVVEATGALDYGARVVLSSIEAGKHVVSMNAELDATIGSLIHDAARRHDVVYTISDGDQPGVILRQADFVRGMGFEITAAINCKRNLDVYQDPEASRGFASRDSTSITMTTAFGDGTKMQIENAVVANVLDLVPDRRGMHGVRTDLANACDDIMSVLTRRGVVEYTLGGDFGGGIGIIGYAEDAEMVQPYMRYSKMGDGPDYFFFRPYHLIHFELPVTIAQVLLDKQPLGTISGPPVTDVIAIAKRDLSPGDELDGIGGFACYGHIDAAESAAGLLPIGLAEHGRITRPVKKDDPIPLDGVDLDAAANIVKLREQQDSTWD